jgi:DNA-binding NtrC family response regulator
MLKLCSYDFPGNVRELENTVHHALVMAQGEHIGPDEVRVSGNPGAAQTRIDLSQKFRELKKSVVETFEREYTEEVLRVHQGNIAAAARQAGIDRKNLWSLVKKYGIDVDDFRRGR